MKEPTRFLSCRRLYLLPSLVLLLLGNVLTQGQDVDPPTVTSFSPAEGAFDVPVNTPVTFTFSEKMNPNPLLINVTFQKLILPFTLEDLTNFTASWSVDQTTLTCTFNPSLPPSSFIVWTLGDTFEDLAGNLLDTSVNTSSGFQTGTGSGGTGTGTNAVTSCLTLRQVDYDQTTPDAPQLSAEDPFVFSAGTILASNRTATTISVIPPTLGPPGLPLMSNPFAPESWFFVALTNNAAAFDTAFPIAGSYIFNITAPGSNQNVTVQFPPGPQPAPLHVSNFAASQTIATNQAFTLTWDPQAGGTADDFIFVDIGQAALTSPDFGEAGALTGLSTSFEIPAGTLWANSNYNATITFYRFNVTSNFTTRLATTGALLTSTTLNLKTVGGGVQPVAPTLANFQILGGQFQFDVSASPGQVVIIDRAASPLAGAWQPVLTNTLAGTPWIVSEPLAAGESRFYRARTP